MMDVTDIVEKMKGESGGVFEAQVSRRSLMMASIWGVPFAINPWPMHVRMDVLEENGLDYPQNLGCFRRNLPEGAEAALLRLRYGPRAHGQDATDNIMQLCWCFGGKTVDESGAVVFDSPENVAGFTFINEMYNTHKIIPKGVVGNADTAWNNKAYQSVQVAFINNPTSVYAYLAGEDPELMEKTGLFGVPAGPAGAVNQIDTWSLGVFSAAPEPDLAKGLAEHMMAAGSLQSGDHQHQMAASCRSIPSCSTTPGGLNGRNSPSLSISPPTGVPISYAGPPTAASGEILATHVIPEALQLTLVEGIDPAEAVGEAHQKIAAIYERLAE